MISYVSCHDDMCLVDRLKSSIPGITPEELARLDKLAQTAVFTSQGVPFIYAGEEVMRDKKAYTTAIKVRTPSMPSTGNVKRSMPMCLLIIKD